MKVIGIIGVIVILLFGGLFVYSTYFEKKTTTVVPDKKGDQNVTKGKDLNETKKEEPLESSDLDSVLGELDKGVPAAKNFKEDHIDDLISSIEDKTNELVAPTKEEKKKGIKKAPESSEINKLDYSIVKWELKGSSKNVLIVDANVTNKGEEDKRFLFTLNCSYYDDSGKELGVQKKDYKSVIVAGETTSFTEQVFGRVSDKTTEVKCNMSPRKKEVFKADGKKGDMPFNALPAPEIGL